MPSFRPERVAEAIREVVASAILFEMHDPRVKGVTVLGVEITSDLREACVHVSVVGTETQQRQAMKGLKSASGFLQSRLASRLKTRFIPLLSFVRDEAVKKSVAMSRLIDEVIEADRQMAQARESGEPLEVPTSSSSDAEEEPDDVLTDSEDDDPEVDDASAPR